MFLYWFFHSFAGWLLRKQLLLLVSFFSFVSSYYLQNHRLDYQFNQRALAKKGALRSAGAATTCRMPDSRFGVCSTLWDNCSGGYQ